MAYNNHNIIISAIVFCLGAVIDEAQEDSYIARRSGSGARNLLLMTWMVVGFFYTMSYKSYMRTMMIKIDYEKTIDTIDDMLKSEIPIQIVWLSCARLFIITGSETLARLPATCA